MRLSPLLLILLAGAGCVPEDGEGREVSAGDAAGTSEDTLVSWAQEARASDPDRRRAASDATRQSRSTAIVEAASRVAPSVVSVNVIRRERVRPRSPWERFFLPPDASRRSPALGSGFLVDSSGIVLTNEHVVRGAERIMVTLPDGRDLPGTLVGADEVTDVAVVQVEADGSLPAAPLGSSRDVLIGEWAVALGNPFGNLFSNTEPTVTAGVVSALGRHIVTSDEDRGFYLGMIQTDASINPGNSGGPLVNALGEVIGINSSIFSRSGGSEGVGFAIPIDRALRIAEDLLRHGEVRRAWLGAEVEPVEADPWGRSRGVRVSRIAPASPAGRAGLEPGVRLLSANGRRLAAPLDYEAVLLDLRVGDPVSLVVEGRSEPVDLVAGALPSVQAERVRALEAMDLVTVTPEIRSERGIVHREGALIVDARPELQSQLGLRPGDVLLQINSVRVTSAEQAAETLRSFPGGRIRIYFERNGGVSVREFHWRR